MKNQGFLGIKVGKLKESEAQIINKFNLHRNWGLHIPESLLTQKRNVLKIDSEFVAKYEDTIIVPRFEYFEIQFMENFNKEILEVLEAIETLKKRMISDYEILIGKTCKIDIERQQVKPYGIMKIVENSMTVQ